MTNWPSRQRLPVLPPPEPIRCGEKHGKKHVAVRIYRYYDLVPPIALCQPG